MPRKIRKILHDRPVNKARAASPIVFGQGIADHRYKLKPGELLFPLRCNIGLIEILRPAASPIQGHGPGDILKQCVLNN